MIDSNLGRCIHMSPRYDMNYDCFTVITTAIPAMIVLLLIDRLLEAHNMSTTIPPMIVLLAMTGLFVEKWGISLTKYECGVLTQ